MDKINDDSCFFSIHVQDNYKRKVHPVRPYFS